MNNLSLDGIVLDTFLDSLDRDVFSVHILVHLGNVLSLVLDGVVVGDKTFARDLDHLSHLLVLDVGSFIGNISINEKFKFFNYSILLSPLIAGA